MTALLIAVFVASLVGSLHCAGMCGGIVTLCVSGKPVSHRRAWAPHVLYNGGRLVIYTALGMISGMLGAAMNLGGAALGWSRIATICAGCSMVIIGVCALLQTIGVEFRFLRVPEPVRRPFRSGMSHIRRLPAGLQPFLIGLLTGLLPCGWLYAFVISAAGTGSPWIGALVMVVFWAGTVPIMLMVGVGVQAIVGPFRQYLPRLTATALVLVGGVTVFSRLQSPVMADGVLNDVSADDPISCIESIDQQELPCCHGDS